ncbi:hypothetical protein Q765_04965 [Flavobacterium rivuli WB 3.3-2 = DSM 21788]|uniref:Carboxypeptidase regulatory-like domain-containing protein n=1 Tax=Flavobacterium rivuli WB 3.3-2 = DSM 21788 TaxID=1121895 RepID=A0A0A2M6D1_9FLAO|nr:hypothetical protein [Flavobacterium rivuli]KGO87839.1 hypothetical protein Q765_04965 [Flavobacterium rivuli WB 3.3-2 = DSM 21788]
MIKFLIVLLAVISCSCSSKIVVKGNAATEGKSNLVLVVLNDTLSKYAETEYASIKTINKIYDNRKYVAKTDVNGKFKIKAYMNDSLYFISPNYISKKFRVADLAQQKSSFIILEPVPCLENVKCDEAHPKLNIVVAKKLKLTRVNTANCPNVVAFDSKYNAEYKVLKNVHGNFSKDIINFEVYSHNGIASMYNYDILLLYIADLCGKPVLVKYQFTDVYKTEDGRWAAPYNPFLYDGLNASEILSPEIIKFRQPIKILTTDTSQDWVKENFPAPYYEIRGNEVIPVYGNYIEDIIELKKKTVLKNYTF